MLLLQELCLPYEVSAADLDEAEPQAMLLLVTYLFTALPQLLPRATLDFSCKLGDQQVCYVVPLRGFSTEVGSAACIFSEQPTLCIIN